MITIKNIQDMSDSGILVATALETAKIYGQVSEDWKRVAEIYSLYKEEVANQMIEEELGEEYLLDVETCKEWLIAEQESMIFDGGLS